MGNILNGILNISTMGASGALGLDPNTGDKPLSANQQLYGKTGAKYLKLLSAYGAGLPQQLAWQKQYQPDYTDLGLQNTNQELNGDASTPGYLDIYKNSVVPAITSAATAANTATRTANLNDLSTLGPGVLAAIKAADPGQTGLTDKLTQDAQTGLDAGSQLTADQFRNVNNTVNASNASRGVAYGPAAAYANVLGTSQYGDQQYQQRQDTATGVAQMNNQDYTAQILQALGIQSPSTSQGQPLQATGTATGTSAGPSIFSAADSTGLFNAVFNQNAASSIASKNNNAALEGAGIGAVGSLAGGAMSFI